MLKFSTAVFIAFLFCAAGFAAADNDVKISGFGTFALTTSDSNDQGFRRNCHSGTVVYRDAIEFRHDSSLGIQADFTVFPELRGVVQLLARDRLDSSVENAFNYVFLEYIPFAGFAVRGGRVPLDIFLLSDYREVGFAYLWVRPVPEIYRTLFYDNYEGVSAHFSRQLYDGLLELQGYVGTLDAVLPLDTAGDLTLSFEPIWGITANYLYGPWRFVSGFQRGIVENVSEQISVPQKFFANLSDTEVPHSSFLAKELSVNGSNSDYISGGIGYEGDFWQIQGEVSRYRFQRAFGITYTSGYLSTGYKINNWTPYVVMARVHGDFTRPVRNFSLPYSSPKGEMIVSAFKAMMRDVYTNQSTLSLGTRWDVCNKVAIKFQWDHSWISNGHSMFWTRRHNAVEIDSDDSVNVFTVAMSFIF